MLRLLGLVPILCAGMLLVGCKGGKDQDKDHDHQQHDHQGAAPAPGGMQPEPGASVPTTPEGPAQSAIVNTKCPMMAEPIDPAITVDYKGKKVAFCCKECIPDWEKLSDAEKDAKLKQ